MANTDRVFDNEIRDGLRRYYLREYENGTVEVFHVKRNHSFKRGYNDKGPHRSLSYRLTTSQARAMRDLLDDYLEGENDD